MERHLGHDFGSVRVHADAASTAAARGIGAYAFTVGNHVAFDASHYAPHTSAGARLLAHELVHTMQQGPLGPGAPSALELGAVDDPAEHEAAALARGAAVSAPTVRAARVVRRAAIATGRILAEGSCAHLACNSKWACVDDSNGVACGAGTRNATATTGHKYRPLFTCDTNCEAGETCSSTDTYMALPKTRFARTKCGQDLVICANGKFTHAQVRDRSEREAWEVSPAVLGAVGVTTGDITNGAIYGDESDAAFLTDSRCRSATPPKTYGPPDAGTEPDAGTDPVPVPVGPPLPEGYPPDGGPL
jgi:hypothetical protein